MLLYSQSAGEFNQSSPSIVLIHGLFGNSDNLAVIRRHFEATHHVLSIDLPDHGRSPKSSEWSFETAALSVVETIKATGISQCYLIGHSLGGKVSMRAAHISPDLISKLVILDIAPVAYQPHHQNVLKGLDNIVLSTLSGRKHATELLGEHVKDAGTISFLLKSLYQDDSSQWQWRFNLQLIKTQYSKISDWPYTGLQYDGDTTFVKGANSDYITSEYQAAILQQFPHAKAKIVPAGHWLHAEKTQLVNTLLTRVLLDA